MYEPIINESQLESLDLLVNQLVRTRSAEEEWERQGVPFCKGQIRGACNVLGLDYAETAGEFRFTSRATNKLVHVTKIGGLLG